MIHKIPYPIGITMFGTGKVIDPKNGKKPPSKGKSSIQIKHNKIKRESGFISKFLVKSNLRNRLELSNLSSSGDAMVIIR